NLGNRGRSALLADRQRSYDLAGDESERPCQVGGSHRILELSRPIEGDPHGIENGRLKDCVALQRYILPPRTVLLLDISQHLWFVVAVIVELVPAKNTGRRCELVIQPAHEKILPNDIVPRSNKFADVQVIARSAVLEDLAVGVRIILEERNDLLARGHGVGSV